MRMTGIVAHCGRCGASVRAMVGHGCAAVYPNGPSWRERCWRRPAKSLFSCSNLMRAIRSAARFSYPSAAACVVLPVAGHLTALNGLDVIPESG